MSPTRVSRFETAIRAVLEFNESFNRHDVDGMMQLMSDDCLVESTGPAPEGTVYTGKEAVAEYWREFFRESPQAHINIEEIFSAGYRCIVRWTCTWASAAGQQEHIRGADIYKVKGNLISEKFSYIKG